MIYDYALPSDRSFLRPRRILTIGGSQISSANAKFCRSLGKLLVNEPNLVLVTGGLLRSKKTDNLNSADWSFVQGARETICEESRSEVLCIETVLPEHDFTNTERFNAGKTILLKKKTAQARRFAMVNSVDVIVAVAGDKGTLQQMELALAIDKPILPVPFTMEASRQVWDEYREEIKSSFNIDDVTSKKWESISFEKLDEADIENMAISIKEHLMYRLRRRCFIMMPYSKSFLPLYQNVISPAVKCAGLTPIRSDHLDLIGNALKVLRNIIDSCECAIAVTTSWNANVMYELGLIHAMNKPVVILHELNKTGKLPKIPFDLSTEYFLGYLSGNYELLKEKICEILRSNTNKF